MARHKKQTDPAFLPPPHANAETHRLIMERLAKMTPAEICQTAVDAGIYTADGQLTEHYAPRRKRRAR
jgi:hypothetical protein